MALSPRQGPPMGPPPSPEYMAENIGPKLLAIDGTLFGVAMLTVILRFYVRIFVLKMFGIDDWMMVISALLSVTCMGFFVKVVKLGLGRHAAAVDPANVFPILKYMYFYSIFIIFAYSFIKLSIGFFLLRLADRTNWRKFLQGTLVFLVMFTIGSTMAIIFQCNPVRAGWDFTLRPPTGNAKCYPTDIFKNVGVFNSSINIATDLIFALIPIPIVWKLQVNLRTKVGLGAILGLGLFASATAIYKTPMQYNFFKELDWSGNGSWYYIWQQVEMNVGIIAACLPTLKPLFASFFGHIRAMTGGSNGRSSGYKSNGYYKQSERKEPGTSSIALKNMTPTTTSTSQPSSPYDVEGSLGKDGAIVYANGDKWDRRLSKSGESDESILPHQGRPNGRYLGTSQTRRYIVRTTEVNVS